MYLHIFGAVPSLTNQMATHLPGIVVGDNVGGKVSDKISG
jgi:hypothetical protein